MGKLKLKTPVPRTGNQGATCVLLQHYNITKLWGRDADRPPSVLLRKSSTEASSNLGMPYPCSKTPIGHLCKVETALGGKRRPMKKRKRIWWTKKKGHRSQIRDEILSRDICIELDRDSSIPAPKRSRQIESQVVQVYSGFSRTQVMGNPHDPWPGRMVYFQKEEERREVSIVPGCHTAAAGLFCGDVVIRSPDK